MPVRASSRCAFVHRFGQSRQDRFHHGVVKRRDFPGPRRLRSTGDALLLFRPFGRRLRTLCPQVSPADRSSGFSWGPPERWLQPTRVRVSSALCRRWLLTPRLVDAFVRPRTRRTPSSDVTSADDCTSSDQAPVHRDPRSPLRAIACGGRASLGHCRLSISATRLQRTGTSTCVAPAPAFRSRASREVG
jgi:hypothetical protein